MWDRYDVCERSCGVKTFDHPKVSGMTLTYEVMQLARTGGQRLVVYQAPAGSPDEEALSRLDPAARA